MKKTHKAQNIKKNNTQINKITRKKNNKQTKTKQKKSN